MLALLKTIREIVRRWWSEFTLQTKLMAAATLMVSLVVSSFTFWAVNTIQEDARINDTRFGRDLGLLLASNVVGLVAEEDRSEVARFSARFYNSTSSVRYMLYADKEGQIFFGIPFSDAQVQNSLTIQRRMQLPDRFASDSREPLVRQHSTPNGVVTDVFVPLIDDLGNYLGVLAVGTNPNPTVVTSSNLTRDVTIAVFVLIWVMVTLGVVFNALIITQPIKELLVGVKNIAAKNFKQRIDLPLGGELGELIESFNEMAERLEGYEEQNIEQLTAEKAKLETLVSTIADGAVLLDSDLQVILVNPTAGRIFGWEGKELVGTNVLHSLPTEVQVEITRPLYQVARGEREGGEFRISLSQPTSRTIRILITTVLDREKEKIKSVAMTVQDITREAELNEAKSQFISNVSHELRTPLFNIKSFIETLHDYGDDLGEEERLEFLETANHETDRLTRLVNDVLDLSRLESCRIYHLDGVELAGPIEQILRTYQLNAKEKGIQLCQEIETDLAPVLGHYDLLLQVFANLVGNSLKFTPSGGKVAIRAYRLPLWVSEHHQEHRKVSNTIRVEVSDTGIGIDPEDREAIFDRFFRVENRVHTLEGTGLGLSIVRNIIDKHHTTIHLVSEVGVGTTFWFDLPVFDG
ncbi:MAG: ATP-binding protein [Cyanobacteriota bacterium]|nr:ATP-binding protein [Cyanobacteriota bacterium]